MGRQQRPVLLSVYARCITGQIAGLQQRIEGPQALPGPLWSTGRVVPQPWVPEAPSRAR